MRYEDTSNSVSNSATPEARDDADALATGSNGPATGNVITGAGTLTGQAGADGAPNGHVVEIRGAGGTDTAEKGQSMHVDGRFGALVIDEQGNYKYVADGHAPEDFRDLFQYTLADPKGGRSIADLVISRGAELKVADNAQRVVPGPDGVVTLPAGVDLNDVHVLGRDLIVTLPDGSQIVIVDGAVFVPQLVLGGVEVPSTNLASLLVQSELNTTAGPAQSSGGNFDVPVPPLDPGVPLGDLIPPTELQFGTPIFEEIGQFVDREPEIQIQPEDQSPSVAAQDSVDERGLPTRNGGEPAGSGEGADGNGGNNSDTTETTTGTIIVASPDAPSSVSITVNGVTTVISGAVGQVIAGQFGNLTITGFDGDNILYSYTLHDNTSGNDTHDDFIVTVTDNDGDQATATLRIDIIDDVPTARPDTDAVAAGTFGPETGNVLTGVGTTSGAAGADTVGADNAHISGVTGFNGSVDNDATGGFVVNGQYGVLTLQSDGSYSYTRNPGTPGGVNDVFNYTLLDGDGDTSATTLTISIGDSTPQTGENPLIRFDDDALPGGNPVGVGDDSPDTVNASGTLAGSGGDGPITFAVQTTGAPAGFSYVSGGAGVVLIQQNGQTVLTVTVGANGSYSVVQNAPIDHPAGSDENNQIFTLNYSVTDQDNDSASGSFTINVDDDTPIAHNDVDTMPVGAVGPETGNVITGAGTDGGAGGAGADSVGADTPGAITGLASNNVPANVDNDAAGGFVVVGQYGTLTMQADGSYSYTRTDGSPVGNVQDVFTYTLTDGDGDSTPATLTLNISDSGPNVGENPGVGLDDDALAGGNANGTGDDADSVNASGTLSGSGGDGALTFAVDTTGAPAGFSYVSGGAGVVLVQQGGVTVLTVTVGSNGSYSVVQNAPIDHVAGSDENNSDFTINYSVTDADGDSAPGTLNISVDDDTPRAFNDTDVTNPATDTADGNVITGVGTIEGAPNADSPGADGFSAISNLVGFNGSSDNDPSGGFSVNGQFGSLQMDANGNYTYTRNPGTPGGAVDTFTYTYLDGDGDPATATLTITIADNTPVAGNVNVGLDDDALAGGNANGTGDDADSVNPSGTLPGSGGDAPLTFGVLLTGAPAGFSYVSGGAGVVLVQQGGVTVLTVTVGSNGSYSVVQNAPINHAVGGDENNQPFTINYTVTDSDLDVANGTISISVDDDTPTVSANAAVQLDDDALAGGNANGIGDDANATNTSGTLAHSYGADGAGSVAYLTSGAPAGFSYALQPSGDLWVMQGATHVLTLTVNSSTGAYTVSQVAPIDHAAGLDENNASFTISYQVTDHDGDTATGSIVVNVDDDTPTVTANAAVQLDDDALAGGNADGVGDDANATNTSGTLAHSYGADGAGSVAYLTTGAPAGFSYALQPSGDLWVMQGATHVLTLTVNSSTGAYTVSQVAPIDHAAGLDENNASFTISYQVTDHDGDTATGSIVVNVDDDTPTVSANNAVQLDDDALAGGNANGTGDVNPDTANTSGTLGHSYGADGAGSTAYLTTGAPAGFSYVLQPSGDLWVMQGATHVITLTVNSSTGAYTVSQVAPIDHPAGANENDVAFTISYQVTDHDGDTATGSIVVNVDDDTPTVSANTAVQLDDDALAGGNANGTGDVNPDTANTSGTLGHSYGADGAGSVAYLTSGAPAGFSYALQPSGDLWVMQGATHVITLTVNSSTGAYTVSQVAPISHAAGGDENDASFTISYQVTDHDGDTATGSIVVNVDDDTPTAQINLVAGENVSLDESVGVQADSNDIVSPAVAALFAGVATPGTDTDLPQYATNADAIVTSTGSSVGADAPGTTGFSLDVSAPGVDSGLNTTDGHDIVLTKEGDLIVGRVSDGPDAGKAAFAIAIDNTGHISTVEYMSIQHPDGTNADDSVSVANGAVVAVVTVTDADGDSASQSVGIGSHIQFQDSGPVLTAVDNINIQNSGDVAHTGAFDFNLGADGANASNDVITNVTGSATVNGVAVTNYVLTPGAETATTASYSFSFDYPTGGGNTAHETGTLVFDKAAGTYTVDLANPIQGFTILQTAAGTLFQGYEFGTSTLDNSQPAISVTQIQGTPGTPLASDLFVQFTSVSEPSSGTGDNNLEVTNWVPGANNPAPINGGGDTSWSAGQLFNQVDGWVSTSGSANGVDGDTTQGGEVLDFTLVQGANPTGVLAQPATFGQASSMFLKFDGIGSAEDMIVVLKLFDPNTNTYTTRAVMIENGDIQKGPGSGPGAFSGISLDNNDGLVIIESNDYNLPGENWVIVGAQIAGSDEGITGTAINLNGAIGAAGDSITAGAFDTQSFASDVNDGPFKISSIGFLTNNTTNQNAHLDFNVTVTDGDGDSITQPIAVDVTQNADSATPIVLGGGVTTVAAAPLSSKASLIDTTSDPQHQTTTNSNNVLMGAFAAAGVASSESLAAEGNHVTGSAGNAQVVATVQQSGAMAVAASDAAGGHHVDLMAPIGNESAPEVASSAASHASDAVAAKGLSAAGSDTHQQAPSEFLQATQAPVHEQVASHAPAFAAGIVMPAALVAAHGNAQPNAVVGQVLADALHGGAGEATIETALASLPGHGGANAALAALASHAGAAVSNGDSGVFAAFTAGHSPFNMEAMAVHADAVQTHV